jgi:DNA mismatch repair protein MutL
LEGGRQVSLAPKGAPIGTTVTVENLFYNVPARLKFLKAPATEAGHIHRIVVNYALAYPELRFHLILDQRVAFQSSGGGDLHDVLVEIMGLETARQMVPIEASEAGEVGVSGYVGLPSLHRARGDQLTFFVNRRWIQDRSLAVAVTQAYHTFLPIGRYPAAVVGVRLNPADVDVNVHPTKSEVKFRDPQRVFSAVQKAVRSTVKAMAPVPSIGGGARPSPAHDWAPAGEETERWRHAARGGGQIDAQLAFEAQRTLPDDGSRAFQPAGEGLPLLRVVGQVAQMYIIAEGPDGLYLVDQHAAHERVLYEQLQAGRAGAQRAVQQLLEPATVELTPAQAAVLEAEAGTLVEIGFDLEPFGGTTYRLRAVPEMLRKSDPAGALSDILGELAEGAVPLAREADERLMVTVCKRAAVKAGQTLSMQEMQDLIHQLERCAAPRTCPHGRPTMVHLSAAQLAREFGRL